MTDERLAELKEKYKDRNLLVELVWGTYANHSGYTSKQNGEFLNWLCMMAYKALKERPTGQWIVGEYQDCHSDILPKYTCPFCGKEEHWKYDFCHCGADLREDNYHA